MHAAVMSLGALAITSCAVGSCANAALVQATTQYARSSDDALAQLRVSPTVAVEVCRERAEVAYLSALADDPTAMPTREQFDNGGPAEPGNPTTWQGRCEAIATLVTAVQALVDRIDGYVLALGSASTGSADLTGDVEGAATGLGGLLSMSTAAGLGTLGTVIGDAAQPLGAVSDALAGQWRADQLGALVARGDDRVQTLAGRVYRFLDTVEQVELAKLATELAALHDKLVRRQAVSAIAGSEREVVGFVRRETARIEIAKRLMNDVAASHRELRDGWGAPDTLTASTVAAIATMVRTVRDDLDAWNHAWSDPR